MSTTWRIPVADAATSAAYEPATPAATGTVFVMAHGAGGHMADRGMLTTANALRERGLDIVRFNFLYKEAKRGRPDPMPLLKKTFEAVAAHARTAVSPRHLVIGGRSMGGRAASMLAAEGFACDALLLLAYPLHPAGKPDQLRDAHLPSIDVPTLCLNGTRDALCRRDLMESVLPRLGSNFRLHWLDGADHSFHVLKSSGRTDADVMQEIGVAVEQFLNECVVRTARPV